jgi:hypothetical protein
LSDEGAAVSAVTFDYWNTLWYEARLLFDAGVGSAGVALSAQLAAG